MVKSFVVSEGIVRITPTTQAQWSAAEWQGKMLVDINGEKIGKLQDVSSMSRPTYRSLPRSKRASSDAT